MKHALTKSAVAAAALASLLGLATPASAHTIQGQTFWSDGSTYQYVFEGMTVTAYATNAVPGATYYLVIAAPGGSPCENGTLLNPNPRVASGSGSIPATSGVVTQSGDWQVTFCASSTRTASAYLTVDSTTH